MPLSLSGLFLGLFFLGCWRLLLRLVQQLAAELLFRPVLFLFRASSGFSALLGFLFGRYFAFGLRFFGGLQLLHQRQVARENNKRKQQKKYKTSFHIENSGFGVQNLELELGLNQGLEDLN